MMSQCRDRLTHSLLTYLGRSKACWTWSYSPVASASSSSRSPTLTVAIVSRERPPHAHRICAGRRRDRGAADLSHLRPAASREVLKGSMLMTLIGWLQILLYCAIIVALVKPLGGYMTRVFNGERTFLSAALRPVEAALYRVGGIDEKREQDWLTYTVAMLFFHIGGFLILFVLMR